MKELLQKTFQNPYSHENFVQFCAEFFQKSSSDFEFQKVFPENEEEKYSDTRHLLSFETDDKKRIEVLSVELKTRSNVENARSYQRALMEKYIKNRIHQGKWVDGVFVAFYVAQESSWRLSFVHMELKDGKQEFSPPKRHSFLVGTGESTHTAQQQIAEVLKHKKTPLFFQVLGAFSVEKVTTDFYSEIQNAFFALSGGNLSAEKSKGYTEKKRKEIESFCQEVGVKTQRTNKSLQIQGALTLPHKNSETHHKDFQDFAVRLFGRLVFCWFLKKKKFETSQKPLISEKILSKKAVKENQNYYHTILEPLFFETLNAENPRKYDFPEHLKEDFSQIPFLNGGLFQNHAEDFYTKDNTAKLSLHHSPQISNEWFFGFFKILERYNFTIDENSKLETEVSIDPEILGRIFENLLAEINPETGESARKSSGSFYTPREIVDYMVEESLLEYLRGKFPPSQRKPMTQKEFLEMSTWETKKIETFWNDFPTKNLRCDFSYFLDEGYKNTSFSPRLFLKLRGELETKEGFNNPHESIVTEVWEALFHEKMQIVHKFFGKPKEIFLKGKLFLYPSVHVIFSWNNRFFTAFFTPLFSGEMVFNTLFEINEKRVQSYTKKFPKILEEMEKKFETKSRKSSWEDADPSIRIRRKTTTLGSSAYWSDQFSAVLQELFQSRGIISNEELRVKFGGASALWKEVEDIVSGTGENTEEKAKEKILDAIDELKILDPACGSGAFPMGILQKVVHILEKIDPENTVWLEKLEKENPGEYEKIKDKNYAYQRKLMIIQKSIFGVDIQEMAVEISRLRFFLSLVVEEKADQIEPLPNLDFKFVAANSLIPLPEIKENESREYDYEKKIDLLEKIRDKFFLTHGEKKEELKEKFQKEKDILDKKTNLFSTDFQKKLHEWDPFKNKSASFFDAKWMFGVKNGFDIVIGNPPYVSLEKVKENKEEYKKIYQTVASRGDLYCLFYERGLEISKPKTGILCFITSNKWMRSGYGKSLRGYFAKKTPLQLIDFGGFKVFESATVDTNILLIQNTGETHCNASLHACHFQNDYKKGDDLGEYFQKNCVEMNNLSAESWFLGNSAEIALKAKIEKGGKPLKDWDVKIYRGVLTGIDDAFIIDEKTKDELIRKDAKSAEILKPILEGKNIKRYGYEFANLWVIVAKFGSHAFLEEKYPAIFEHLCNFEEKLRERGQCNSSRTGKIISGKKGEVGQHHWLELDNNPKDEYLAEFEKEKIVWAETGQEIKMVLIPAGMYLKKTCFFGIGKNLKYISGIANSKLIDWWTRKNSPGLGKSGMSLTKDSMQEMPIPQITPQNQKIVHRIEELVEEILAVKKTKTETTHLETQIDELVFALYELTEEEREVVLAGK